MLYNEQFPVSSPLKKQPAAAAAGQQTKAESVPAPLIPAPTVTDPLMLKVN